MFVLPPQLHSAIRKPFHDPCSYVCMVVACREVSFGTQGRKYAATLLVDNRIYSNVVIPEINLERAMFIHRAG